MGSNLTSFNNAHSVTALNGYDAVAYFSEAKPVRDNGHHLTVVDGVTCLFASEDNKKKFEADPGNTFRRSAAIVPMAFWSRKSLLAPPRMGRAARK